MRRLPPTASCHVRYAPCRAPARRAGGIILGALLLFASTLTTLADEEAARTGDGWRELEPGLDFGEFTAPRRAANGDSRIRILRIDPQRFELRLMNASASTAGEPLTARHWCERHGLVAAINASMYQTDFRRSVSLMQTRTHTNNPRLSKDNTVLAFDPLDPGDATLPAVQIIDRQCQDLDSLRTHYGTLVQSIRMVSCRGNNVWSPQERRYSTAAIGVDRRGRVLFIHVRTPFSTHDLIDILLGLPIELGNAMYCEGGPEAQLFVAVGGEEHEHVGVHGAMLAGDETISIAWPVPNVIGVVRRAK